MRTFSRLLASLFATTLFVVAVSGGVANAEDPDAWAQLVEKVEALSPGQNEISIDSPVAVSEGSPKLTVHEGVDLTLSGSAEITGLGSDAINVEPGGTLTLAGPSFTNLQIVANGDLSFTAGSIHDTSVMGPVILVDGGAFTMSDSAVFTDNSVADEAGQVPAEGEEAPKYAPITGRDATINILGGTISRNAGLLHGGAIGVWGSSPDGEPTAFLNISGGQIIENKVSHKRLYGYGAGVYAENAKVDISGGLVAKNVTERGGGLALVNSNTTISGGEISGNSNGDYRGNGGGVFASDGSLTIDGGSIEDNSANGLGGGIYTNGAIKVEIYNANVNRNQTLKSGGGAAFLGESEVNIYAGNFSENQSKGFWGGGAIYNDTKATLTIQKALIRDNSMAEMLLVGANKRPVSAQGGGVWNCPTGSTVMHITNGVAMFENTAPDAGTEGQYAGAGDDFVGMRPHKFDDPAPVGGNTVTLSSRMLGGGERAWYQDGSYYGVHSNWPEGKQLSRYSKDNRVRIPFDTPITDNIAFKSVPSDGAKGAADQIATVRIEGNRATGTGISGGGITNNGKLVFGTEDIWKVTIEKSWSSDIPENRPDSIELDVYLGDNLIQTVELTKENGWKTTLTEFPNPNTLKDAKTGEVIPLTFKERGADGYTLGVTERETDEEGKVYSVKLENRIVTEVPVKKIWKGDDEDARPEYIEVKLLADGVETDKTLQLSNENEWQGAFEDLPKYELVESENGVQEPREISYSIKEIAVEGYTGTLEGDATNGFVLTNTRDVPPPTTTEPTSEPTTAPTTTEPTTLPSTSAPTTERTSESSEPTPSKPHTPKLVRTGSADTKMMALAALLLLSGSGLLYLRRRQ